MPDESIPELRRQLPSFDQWLTDNGDGTRAAGFDQLVDLAARTLEQDSGSFPTDSREAVMLRMWKGMLIAVVELCRIEQQRGTSMDKIIGIIPRACALGCMYAAASVLNDETPWRQLARIMIEEFRFCAKLAADELNDRTTDNAK